MLMNKKTLVDELLLDRKKFISETQLLDEVRAILENNELERQEIKEKLKSKSSRLLNF